MVERIVDDVAVAPLRSQAARRNQPGVSILVSTFSSRSFGAIGASRPADVARSLLAATARILHESVERDARIPCGLSEILLSGGGAKNPVLVDEVRACFDADVPGGALGRLRARAPRGGSHGADCCAHAGRLALVTPEGHRCFAAAVLGHVHLAYSLVTTAARSDCQIRSSRTAIRPLNLDRQAHFLIGEAWLERNSELAWA